MKLQNILLKAFFTLAIYAFSSNCFAEKVKASARIYSDDGVAVIELYDGAGIICTVFENDLAAAILMTSINEAQYNSQSPVKKGDKLVDWEKNIIGEALQDLPWDMFSAWTSGGAPDNPKIFGLDIHGTVKQADVYPNSIIENVLPKLINDRNLSRRPDFDSLFKEFGFTENNLLRKFYPNTTEFGLHDEFYVDGRVVLVFEKDELAAIIYAEEMLFNKAKSHKSENGKIAIFKLPPKTSEKDFIKKYHESLIGVN